MSFIVYLIILSLYYSNAVDIAVYEYSDYYFDREGPVTRGSDAFKFGYHIYDILVMRAKLLNVPPNATAALYFISQSDNDVQKTQPENYSITEYYFTRNLKGQRFFVDVELVTETGSCSFRISEGRAVTSPPTWPADEGYEYNDICLLTKSYKWDGCFFKVDLKNGCKDIPTTTTRPFTKNETSKNNTFVSNVPTSPRDSVEITTDKMTANDTASDSNAIRNISDASNTTNITGDHGAGTADYTVIIISTVSAVSLILCVGIAIQKRCWIFKTRLPETQPTNYVVYDSNTYM